MLGGEGHLEPKAMSQRSWCPPFSINKKRNEQESNLYFISWIKKTDFIT